MSLWNYEVREELVKVFCVDQINLSQNDPNDQLLTEIGGSILRYENPSDQNRFLISSVRLQNEIGIYAKNKKTHGFSKIKTFLDQFFDLSSSRRSNKLFQFRNPSEIFKVKVNAFGDKCALIYDEKVVVINLIDMKSFVITLQTDPKEITSFSWNPVYPNRLSIATTGYVLQTEVSEKESVQKIKKFGNGISIERAIKILYSPNGENLLILTSSSIVIYDLNLDCVFSKNFLLKKFTDVTYANNSSFFIVHSQDEVLLFNSYTFEFKSYSNFPGRICSVLSSKSDNVILIFVLSGDELLLYMLYNLNQDDYNVKTYQSYNNIPLSYVHSKFKLFFNVYSVLRGIYDVFKVKMDKNNKYISLLILDQNNTTRCIFYGVDFGKTVHQFKIRPITVMKRLEGAECYDIEEGFDCYKKKAFFIVNNGDLMINKIYLNEEKNPNMSFQ